MKLVRVQEYLMDRGVFIHTRHEVQGHPLLDIGWWNDGKDWGCVALRYRKWRTINVNIRSRRFAALCGRIEGWRYLWAARRRESRVRRSEHRIVRGRHDYINDRGEFVSSVDPPPGFGESSDHSARWLLDVIPPDGRDLYLDDRAQTPDPIEEGQAGEG